MRAAMFASVRRGLLMEELARNTGGDAEMRNELFICGVFSLLDRLFQQPLAELLRVNNAALSISMAGEALSDGGLGERIKVRNLSSQKVLEGAVEADGSVSMAF